MGYDPDYPRKHYDQLGDDEWTRLTRSRRGELNYIVHMDVLRHHIRGDMDVLEIGAGAGIFTKELVHMAKKLVVADLSQVQLDLNQKHMRELGLLDRVDEYRVLDLIDLRELNDASFDAVVCIGGALSYLLDQEKCGVQEALRIVKPGGIAILGVMSLINTVIKVMESLKPERDAVGIDNLRWTLETGILDRDHTPTSEHYCHMMTSANLDSLLSEEKVKVIEKRATGLLSLATEDSLTEVRKDDELWKLVVERELAWSKLPGAVDLGSNIVYVVKKH